jgi:tRNA threonylcarbamoyladenosine biosynthesis protein TsaB
MDTPFFSINMPHTANSKPVSIAVETSGRVGSVALGVGDNLIARKDLSGFRRHSSELLVVINDLLGRHSLASTDIERVYIPRGPGSFTGIRIAVTFAKMAAFALKADIAAIDTLESMAENAAPAILNKTIEIQRLAAILDAKRGLFYIAVFDWMQDHFERASDDLLITADDFLARFCSQKPSIHLLGEGLLFYQKQFEHPNTVILDKTFWPAKADSVWRLGQKKADKQEFESPYSLTPLYIRRPEAEELWEKRKAAPV